MKNLKINHWAVLVIVVLAQVIPAIWYGVFADYWMEYNELTMEEIESKQSLFPYFISIFGSLFFGYTLAYLFMRMGIESVQAGLTMALLMGFSFFAFPTLVQTLFSFRPVFLGFIDGGVYLLIWALAGAILGGWRKYGEVAG